MKIQYSSRTLPCSEPNPILSRMMLVSQEALNAKNSLASTHFYGRHLVGEWAEDKEDVDTLRAKAARDVRGPGDGGRPVKKQKAGGDGDDFADMDG